MSNPYESPEGAYAPPTPGNMAPGNRGGQLSDSSLVRQVKVLCILTFVQAGLELLVGIALMFLGPLLTDVISAAAKNDPNPPPAEFFTIFSTVYLVMGLVAVMVSVFRVPAAVLNINFKARGFGIAAYIFGALTIFGYCWPTAIALTVYGLVVLLNQDVKRAFALGKQGYTRQQILDAPRYE